MRPGGRAHPGAAPARAPRPPRCRSGCSLRGTRRRGHRAPGRPPVGAAAPRRRPGSPPRRAIRPAPRPSRWWPATPDGPGAGPGAGPTRPRGPGRARFLRPRPGGSGSASRAPARGDRWPEEGEPPSPRPTPRRPPTGVPGPPWGGGPSGDGGTRGSARTIVPGEAVPRKEEAGPAQRQAAQSARSTTAGGGPQPSHDLRCSTARLGSPSRQTASSHHPAPHAAPVQRHTHARPDHDRLVPGVGHGVVEDLGDGRHLGAHAHDRRVAVTVAQVRAPGRRRHGAVAPSREQPQDQSPRADRRSSTRGVASQVNSFSDRPKWP